MSKVTKIERVKIIPAKYAGKWVAWSSNRRKIVSSGKTIREARKEAQRQGENNPWLDKIPDLNIRFGGAAFGT